MSFRQITERFELSGVGLHSGHECRLVFDPCDSPVILMRSGENIKNELAINKFALSGTGRGSDYIFGDGEKIRTCEHVLAGLTGLGVWSGIRLTIYGGEMPAFDGCAGKLCEEILKHSDTITIQKKQESCYHARLKVNEPVIIYDGDNKQRFIAAFPSYDNRLHVTYMVDYKFIGSQVFDFDYSPDNFYSDISNARTFAFASDIEYLRSNGMALGGSLDNAILIEDRDEEEKRINASNGLRWPDEFVRHKVLDLIGDLAAIGQPLNAHLIALRAGHSLHLRLAELLRMRGD